MNKEFEKEVIRLADEYAETRNMCGSHLYNAKTQAARNALIEALSAGAPTDGAVPTDAEIQSVWDIACNDTPKSPGWNRHIRYARALLARWGYAAASPQQPFGYWFMDDPEHFATPGSGFKLGRLPPDKSVRAVALYTAPSAVSVPDDTDKDERAAFEAWWAQSGLVKFKETALAGWEARGQKEVTQIEPSEHEFLTNASRRGVTLVEKGRLKDGSHGCHWPECPHGNECVHAKETGDK